MIDSFKSLTALSEEDIEEGVAASYFTNGLTSPLIAATWPLPPPFLAHLLLEKALP